MSKPIFFRLWRSLRSFFFSDSDLPSVSDRSTLREVLAHYPDFLQFLAERYAVTPDPREMQSPLHVFVERHGLPPARIVFMESQLASRLKTVTSLSPVEARRLLDREPQTRVLDVRESWELKSGSLPNACTVNRRFFREIETRWSKETPVLVYCHFGVRSMDAALTLTARGFTRIFTLQGGIDAWSQEVDPAIPRYTGSYC